MGLTRTRSAACALALCASACSGGGGHDDRQKPKEAAYAPVEAKPTDHPIEVTPVPLVVDGHRLDGSIRPRAQAGAITGEDEHTRAAFAVTGPGAGWWTSWDDLSVLAVPDRTWMARRCDGREIDPSAKDLSVALIAAAAGPAVDHGKCVPVIPPGDDFPRPLAALGAGAERAIVLVRETMDVGNQTLFDIAASTDGGKSWALRPGPEDLRSHSLADVATDRVGGTVDLVFRTHKDNAEVLLLLQLDSAHPLDLPPPAEVGKLDLAGSCRRAGTTWWLGDDGHLYHAHHGVVVAVPGDPFSGATDEPAQVDDCSADAALVADRAGVHRCKADGCTAAFATPDGTTALLADGTAVRVALDGRVLRLWHEGAPTPRAYGMPQPVDLTGVVVWKDVAYAVVAEAGAPALVELADR